MNSNLKVGGFYSRYWHLLEAVVAVISCEKDDVWHLSVWCETMHWFSHLDSLFLTIYNNTEI